MWKSENQERKRPETNLELGNAGTESSQGDGETWKSGDQEKNFGLKDSNECGRSFVMQGTLVARGRSRTTRRSSLHSDAGNRGSRARIISRYGWFAPCRRPA